MKKQLFVALIALNMYAFSGEIPSRINSAEKMQKKLDSLKPFLDAAQKNKFLQASLNNNELCLETKNKKECFDSQTMYEIVILLALLSGNPESIPSEKDFLKILSSFNKSKITFADSDNKSEINANIHIQK
ncbi:MAG TPA: hypothetical protein VLG50_08815 [Candidatus Saccharimonadales bacterium]|nr:hypothetical protein [Candidatus Saccharimonadales bacterium]